MLDEPLLVLIRYLSETLNANPPCKLLMLESYGSGTRFDMAPSNTSRHKQFGDTPIRRSPVNFIDINPDVTIHSVRIRFINPIMAVQWNLTNMNCDF